MTTTDQFAGTLLDVAELSELCRIERMEDQFLVFYDSRTLIEVEFKQVSQTAMLMMNVGPLPLENRLLVIETLLEFNFIRCATGSISMAVDSVHDQVVQQQQLSTCDLSTPRLKQALDRFKRLGMQWNTLLQSDLAELADPPTDQEQTDAHLSKFMTV
ncbi:CesT family type III secretion system chaperone [Roseiconus lacunae]|uniref:CesT family type III secretion system chaperone n=1 Tax=Roseiconus lacunae TaxID=2605694 RepID=UPI001E60278F|nr:CesT family type III secretion system chaperone [Roseiconus lacunae]MCD0457902.1 CesT family type III secretion system chaperone [Roseiconus lacunae]